MLIDVFSGRDRSSAQCRGSFYFSCPPNPGENVELAGERFTVAEAWHKPDGCYRGAKFAIFVEATGSPADVSHHLANAEALIRTV
jgi:hypothetical protein